MAKTAHIHILGICGTFMGSIAVLARQLGYRVTGCDENVYPPMSTYLEAQGIEIYQGFDAEQITQFQPDQIVVGNVMSRGKPVIEAVLNQGLSYISGPQWLAENVLRDHWVLMVAGTHGKTTTSSMLAWVLEYAGYEPGFLIGGIPENFGVSSRLGAGEFFVVEGDEYDTAFFDKRSKFVHYQPRTAILNNLEFDHADIFNNIEDIQRQFHHLVRTIPGEGQIICHDLDAQLQEVLAQGCWTPVSGFAGPDSDWQVRLLSDDGVAFEVWHLGEKVCEVHWQLLGQHNVHNALACIAAANHVGVRPEVAAEALATFKSVKRRLELRGKVNQVSIYDDFAHHPTAIEATLQAMKSHIKGEGRVLAVLEPRSNTMRMGHHGEKLSESLQCADAVFVYLPSHLDASIEKGFEQSHVPLAVFRDIPDLVESVAEATQPGDHVVVMSNGGFDHVHDKLLKKIEKNYHETSKY